MVSKPKNFSLFVVIIIFWLFFIIISWLGMIRWNSTIQGGQWRGSFLFSATLRPFCTSLTTCIPGSASFGPLVQAIA